MRDRQPTKVLENGALRYGVYDETGALLRYEYLALEDAPSDVGTDLSKANLLTDDTETALFGSAADRTVNDALAGIAGQLKLIMSDTASITVTLKDSAGTAIPGVLVQGILSESGQAVYSSDSGVVSGYIPEGSQTIKVTGYADIVDYTETISVTKGTTITKTITLTTRDFLKITSSQSVKFSGNVNTVDVTVVGGGGGGGGNDGASYSDGYNESGAGGGGGGYCTVQEDVSFTKEVTYSAVVGAGGTGGSSQSSNLSAGADGGQSSFFGVSANGGKGGMYGNHTSGAMPSTWGIGGAGNGKGGNGGRNDTSGSIVSNATSGTAGIIHGYSSFAETVQYGGGGGGSSTGTLGHGAGAGYGGNAPGGNGQNGYGGGGAGASNGGSSYGGKGGSGCVAIRMHLKSAA